MKVIHVLAIQRKSKTFSLRNFQICNTKFRNNTSHYVKTTTLCLYLEQELHSDEMSCKVFNFPLPYIFVKPQVICRAQKADFDLQPTSVIYIRCKADVIDDTGLRIYSVTLRIQSECRKIRTKITPNTNTFYAVTVNQNLRVASHNIV